MIAIDHFNNYAGFGHESRDLAWLSWFSCLSRCTRNFAIFEYHDSFLFDSHIGSVISVIVGTPYAVEPYGWRASAF